MLIIIITFICVHYNFILLVTNIDNAFLMTYVQALINADEDATGAFKKLSYLLANPPYPPETFGNLLLLHCKYQNYDIAAGLLAENSNLTYKYLSQELYDYLDACIMVPTSIEEAYRKFDELSAKHIERLRKFTKQIQDARLARDSELIKTNLKLYDEDLEKYIPILMAQARIYWDRENYPMVEKLFFQVRFHNRMFLGLSNSSFCFFVFLLSNSTF